LAGHYFLTCTSFGIIQLKRVFLVKTQGESVFASGKDSNNATDERTQERPGQ
jgi:hypothetical protein